MVVQEGIDKMKKYKFLKGSSFIYLITVNCLNVLYAADSSLRLFDPVVIVVEGGAGTVRPVLVGP